jgi:hypothetical protein
MDPGKSSPAPAPAPAPAPPAPFAPTPQAPTSTPSAPITSASQQAYDVLQVSRAETRKKIVILIIVIAVFVGIMMVLSYLGKPCQKSTDTTTPGLLCSTSNLVDSTSQVLQGVSSHMTAIIVVTSIGIGLGLVVKLATGYWSQKAISGGESNASRDEPVDPKSGPEEVTQISGYLSGSQGRNYYL